VAFPTYILCEEKNNFIFGKVFVSALGNMATLSAKNSNGNWQ